MKFTFKSSLLGALALLFTFSCSEDPEAPKPPEVEYPDVTKTIQDLRNLVTGDEAYEVPADFVFKGVVVSNQGESNNFYRALYVQSGEVAIKISCDKNASYETLEEGQEVFVKADGLFVCKYFDTYTLGYQASGDKYKVSLIPADKQEIVLVGGDKEKNITPKEITDLSTLSPDMVGTLVKVNNVQVIESDRNKLLGDADNQGYTTLSFITAEGNSIQISNSNYANFNDQTVPDGSGSITGILNTYGSDFQIAIRGMEDLDLSGTRFEDPTPQAPTPNKTIQDLRNLVTGEEAYEVPADFAFKGVVVSNQGVSNNFYRALYVQSGEVAVKISCDKDAFYETLEEGQEVIVKADGLFVCKYYDTYTLGYQASGDKYKVSLLPVSLQTKVLFAGDKNNNITPKEITDLSTLSPDMVGTLVKVNNVQVIESDRNKLLGNADTQGYTTLSFITAEGNSIQISNSNYASFNDQTVPDGSGSITGVLNTYGSDFQIAIRGMEDLALTGERFEVQTPGGSGTGTKNDPYNVPYVLSAVDDGSVKGWVKGYIIGTIPSTSNATLTGPFTVNTNMLIAESATETDVNKMVSVQLPSGAIRNALNLVDNGSNLGKEVLVLGSLEYYYGFKGVKSLTGYWLNGAGIDPDNRIEDSPTAAENYPAGSFFFENFENAQADMDIYITGYNNLAQAGERLWLGKTHSENKYAQASAYGSKDTNNDMWLVSPAINLDGKTNPNFKCDIKGGYDNGATLEVFVLTDYDGGSTPWTATSTKLNVTLPSLPSNGYADTWASSGDMDLSSFSGSIHIAFKYSGSGTNKKTTTWQIDNINCFEK